MFAQELHDAIVAFDASQRSAVDYLKLFKVVRSAYSQGSGLGGREIQYTVIDAVEDIKEAKEILL